MGPVSVEPWNAINKATLLLARTLCGTKNKTDRQEMSFVVPRGLSGDLWIIEGKDEN